MFGFTLAGFVLVLVCLMTTLFFAWLYWSLESLRLDNAYLQERIAVLEDRGHRGDFLKSLFTMAYPVEAESEPEQMPEEDTTTFEVDLNKESANPPAAS
jgi:hypothetical protein